MQTSIPHTMWLEKPKKCYPEGISVTEKSAKVPLQTLLDHTALRIIEQQKEEINELLEGLEDEDPISFDLTCKWGFDGSSGQSEYKQSFKSTDTSDDSLFCTTLVPLQLKWKDKVIWVNPVPASTRFCRPVHLQYQKETTELSLEEQRCIKEEIQALKPITVKLDIENETGEQTANVTVQVHYDLHLTMVDQKVINAITSTKSSMRCYICGATPKDFHNINQLPQPVEDKYRFGICPLHKWIRCFEMLLHIAYRMSLKTWRVQSDHNKAVMKNRRGDTGTFQS